MKEKGFTLIEMLVALSIATLILGSVVTGIFMIMRGTVELRTESAILADIENSAHWLARDILMGQEVNVWVGDNMTLTWLDLAAEPGEELSHYVKYTHSGTYLLREYDSANNTTIVGRYITDVDFSVDGALVTVTLASSPEGMPRSAVTRKYTIQMRALSEY